MSDSWWVNAVIYQIYPRSFKDTTGNGIGDLQGIEARLQYLKALGVDCIWLSPIHPSPQKDFGYDVADYDAIDPIFGDMDDFKRLLKKTHDIGMRLILDGVYNHTSDQHPWFKEARSSKESPKRDWYIWRESESYPNNWYGAFGDRAWTKDEKTGEWYLHSFTPEQPDLNWRNPDVVKAVLASMKHWFQMGVDGFRLDVFNCYFKSQGLQSNPKKHTALGIAARLVLPILSYEHIHSRDQFEEMFGVLKQMRALADDFGGVLIGETFDESFTYKNAARYAGPERLHMTFNFRLLASRWSARSFREAILGWINDLQETGGWPSWVVNNHDMPRSVSRWMSPFSTERTLKCAKLVPLLLMTLQGTAFIYQGEEIAMTEAWLKRKYIVDPPGKRFWPFFQGRDGCRTPMQWDSSKNAGFSAAEESWLPVTSNFTSRNVEAERAEPESVWHAYRRAIELRKSNDCFKLGSMTIEKAPGDKNLLVFHRKHGNEQATILINMGGSKIILADHTKLQKSSKLLFSTLDSSPSSSDIPTALQPFEGIAISS